MNDIDMNVVEVGEDLLEYATRIAKELNCIDREYSGRIRRGKVT